MRPQYDITDKYVYKDFEMTSIKMKREDWEEKKTGGKLADGS